MLRDSENRELTANSQKGSTRQSEMKNRMSERSNETDEERGDVDAG